MEIINCLESSTKKFAYINLADFGEIVIYIDENQLINFTKFPYIIHTKRGLFKVTEQVFKNLYFKG